MLSDVAHILEELEVKYITPMNPTIPRLYRLVKLHKDGFPIRPIVSYRFPKWLNNFIRKKTDFRAAHEFMNSIEPGGKLKKA